MNATRKSTADPNANQPSTIVLIDHSIENAIGLTRDLRLTAELMARECKAIRDAAEHTGRNCDKFLDVAVWAVRGIETVRNMLVNSGALEKSYGSDIEGRLRDNLTRANAALDRARECTDL